ncbi:CinA family protein [Microbacterium marinilacus]|uniref:CinA family protein n=1 Tax=Microbacterium marinilacus TaxID=415209 RepID=A0ABP7BR53_9MICO|nr:nicotinamide-nucleotide amidohydrolase family protein [Microbacterium marinilacus]MBY0689844.1 nicotinamide-nucleotide amidohydrolase family protein [Microbacterium marinilacus]
MSPTVDPVALLAALRDRGWTVGVAESLTGGLVVATLVDVPGASASVRGGVVAYDTAVKASLLGVDAALLAEHGPVHPEVARQMADGVRRAMAVDGRPADVGIATTGIAGPESPDGQRVGTVHIGVATPDGVSATSWVFAGGRAAVREAARTQAIVDLARAVGLGG